MTVDLFEMIRLGGEMSGQHELKMLERLESSVIDQINPVAWKTVGRSILLPGGAREMYLRLSFTAAYHLRCERCLLPVACTLQEDREFLVVKDEETADRIDLDNDEFDVIAGSRYFNTKELLEDELIMALPLVPLHAACDRPDAGLATDGEGEQKDGSGEQSIEKPNPFALLASLKSKH